MTRHRAASSSELRSTSLLCEQWKPPGLCPPPRASELVHTAHSLPLVAQPRAVQPAALQQPQRSWLCHCWFEITQRPSLLCWRDPISPSHGLAPLGLAHQRAHLAGARCRQVFRGRLPRWGGGQLPSAQAVNPGGRPLQSLPPLTGAPRGRILPDCRVLKPSPEVPCKMMALGRQPRPDLAINPPF